MAQYRSQIRVARADEFGVQTIHKGVQLRNIRPLYTVCKTEIQARPLKLTQNGYRWYNVGIILFQWCIYGDKIGIHISVLNSHARFKTPILYVQLVSIEKAVNVLLVIEGVIAPRIIDVNVVIRVQVAGFKIAVVLS